MLLLGVFSLSLSLYQPGSPTRLRRRETLNEQVVPERLLTRTITPVRTSWAPHRISGCICPIPHVSTHRAGAPGDSFPRQYESVLFSATLRRSLILVNQRQSDRHPVALIIGVLARVSEEVGAESGDVECPIPSTTARLVSTCQTYWDVNGAPRPNDQTPTPCQAGMAQGEK